MRDSHKLPDVAGLAVKNKTSKVFACHFRTDLTLIPIQIMSVIFEGEISHAGDHISASDKGTIFHQTRLPDPIICALHHRDPSVHKLQQ